MTVCVALLIETADMRGDTQQGNKAFVTVHSVQQSW